MKFQYSPGTIGYGTKGTDGSTGLSGLAIYISDYNRETEEIFIKDAISKNEVLWSKRLPGTKLPGSRTYQYGDLFIDVNGNVSMINNTSSIYDKYNLKLSKEDYFIESNITSSNSFQRFHNDVSLKYIIDTVYSAETTYTSLPTTIYGVNPKNFARIEYSTINNSSSNTFTIYSSGEIETTDDHKALGIIRNIDNNTFRIGNIDTTNVVRNTNLIFDVSSLKKNSQNISLNSNISEIITNKDLSINCLLRDILNTNPTSFTAISRDSCIVQISWALTDFSSDPCIHGDLHFYETSTNNQFYFTPLVFSDVTIDSSVSIRNLNNGYIYKYYMSIIRDGWIRKSDTKSITCSNLVPYLSIINPSPATLDASSDGLIDASIHYKVDISTNSPTGWTTTTSHSWITRTPISDSTVIYTTYETFDVSIVRNLTTAPRSGYIDVFSEAGTKRITINQDASIIPVTQYTVNFLDSGYISFTPSLPVGCTYSLSFHTQAYAEVYSDYVNGIEDLEATSTISILKNGAVEYTTSLDTPAQVAAAGGGASNFGENSFTLSGLTDSDVLYVDPTMAFGNCLVGTNDWMDSNAYIYITSFSITYPTGLTATIGSYNMWYFDHYAGMGSTCEIRAEAGLYV